MQYRSSVDLSPSESENQGNQYFCCDVNRFLEVCPLMVFGVFVVLSDLRCDFHGGAPEQGGDDHQGGAEGSEGHTVHDGCVEGQNLLDSFWTARPTPKPRRTRRLGCAAGQPRRRWKEFKMRGDGLKKSSRR